MATQRHPNASPKTVQVEAASPVDLASLAAELRRVADALVHRAAQAAVEPSETPLPPADEALFQNLRKWRADEARKLGMPPYIVATDRVLRAVVEKRPVTVEALRGVPGFGPAKTEKYGASVLELVAAS